MGKTWTNGQTILTFYSSFCYIFDISTWPNIEFFSNSVDYHGGTSHRNDNNDVIKPWPSDFDSLFLFVPQFQAHMTQHWNLHKPSGLPWWHKPLLWEQWHHEIMAKQFWPPTLTVFPFVPQLHCHMTQHWILHKPIASNGHSGAVHLQRY